MQPQKKGVWPFPANLRLCFMPEIITLALLLPPAKRIQKTVISHDLATNSSSLWKKEINRPTMLKQHVRSLYTFLYINTLKILCEKTPDRVGCNM
jgi:hypothetical protein